MTGGARPSPRKRGGRYEPAGRHADRRDRCRSAPARGGRDRRPGHPAGRSTRRAGTARWCRRSATASARWRSPASLTDELHETQLTVEEIRAAVVEAEARHTYCTVHAHNPRGVRNAVAAGVRCIEHGTDLDEETAALMAGAGCALVPTLAVARLMASEHARWGLPEMVVPRVRGVEKGMGDALLLARRFGIPIGSGRRPRVQRTRRAGHEPSGWAEVSPGCALPRSRRRGARQPRSAGDGTGPDQDPRARPRPGPRRASRDPVPA